MEILGQIAEIIERKQLLRPEAAVVAAVSGGADSMCLAWSLKELGYRVSIAHVDHGLRPESHQDAEYVRALAERWDLPFHLKQAEPPAQPRASQEAWARGVRYQFLMRIATEANASAVATGHTADDQVETILMNLIRGAGPEGLAGMPYAGPVPLATKAEDSSKVRLIRPLLGLWRQQTEACCRQAGLTPRQDASNYDLAFTRNRIRHQLMPELAELNPSVKGALLRTGWLMRSIADWIEVELDRIWSEAVNQAEEQGLWIQRELLASQPEALAMAALRRAHQSLTSHDREIEFDHSRQALELVRTGDRGQSLSLPGGVRLEVVGDRMLLAKNTESILVDQVPQIDQSKPLDVEGRTYLAEGWSIQAKKLSVDKETIDRVRGGGPPYDSPHVEAMSGPAVTGALTLREPRPGDEIQPLGLEGRMKLSDFFINEGIPKAQRQRWPLLVHEGVIFWVVGLRLMEPARVRPEDYEIIELELLPPA